MLAYFWYLWCEFYTDVSTRHPIKVSLLEIGSLGLVIYTLLLWVFP